MKRPDGSDWELGTGGFGKVGALAACAVATCSMHDGLVCMCAI